MLVCPDSAAICGVYGCGLDTMTPQHFGGCSISSGATKYNLAEGTLCCCP